MKSRLVFSDIPSPLCDMRLAECNLTGCQKLCRDSAARLKSCLPNGIVAIGDAKVWEDCCCAFPQKRIGWKSGPFKAALRLHGEGLQPWWSSLRAQQLSPGLKPYLKSV